MRKKWFVLIPVFILFPFAAGYNPSDLEKAIKALDADGVAAQLKARRLTAKERSAGLHMAATIKRELIGRWSIGQNRQFISALVLVYGGLGGALSGTYFMCNDAPLRGMIANDNCRFFAQHSVGFSLWVATVYGCKKLLSIIRAAADRLNDIHGQLGKVGYIEHLLNSQT